MADTKVSALAASATPPLAADEIPVNEAGTSKKVTIAQLFTAPVFAAQSASAGSAPKLTPSATLMTTAEDGAIEMDDNCLYACTDAGNRGVVPIRHIIRADTGGRTFTSDTNQQALFASPTNGRLTLETGVYSFECLINMSAMSATSGNGKFSLIGAGSATLGSVLYLAYGVDIANDTLPAAFNGLAEVVATQVAANITTAAVATVLTFRVRGTFEVTVAGTIVPSFAQTTAATPIVTIGSFFMVERIGSTSLVSVGQWD